MKWVRSSLAIAASLLLARGVAQPPPDESPELPDVIEDIVAETDAEFDYDTYFEHLNSYVGSPLNLNTGTEEELLGLGILSNEQVQSLLNYIKFDGALLSLYELQAVRYFDPETIAKLLPYVTVESKQGLGFKPRDFFDGRHLVFVRYQQLLEQAMGYVADTSGATSYPGSNARYYLRYRFNAGRKLQYGVTAEKDPGEAFFSGAQSSGFDYYSAHLFLRDLGVVRALAIGDFEVSVGQGLALWSGFGFSKGAQAFRLKKGGYALKPYTSVNENRFMRGVGATLGKNKWELTVFGSSKKEDGNVILLDTIAEEVREVSSLQESGLHRTASEIADRDAIGHVTAGALAKFSSRQVDFGTYVTYNKLSAELNKTPRPYNQFQFSGDQLLNYGVHYTFAFNNVTLFGETAISDNGGLATLNAVQMALDHRVAFVLLHKHYEKDYQQLLANAFGEGSEPNNETGVYAGVRMGLSSTVTFEGYADFYKHPWLKFTVDKPSTGQEYFGKLSFKPSYDTELYIRSKYETKDANTPGNETAIDFSSRTKKFQARAHFSHKLGWRITLRSRAEFSLFDAGADDEVETGFMVYQDVIWSVPRKPLKLYGRFAMFDTDSYNTRIYAYENDVLYAFSIPAYYDKGTRVYVMAKYQVAKWLDIWLRLAQTYFADFESIGSGNDEIAGNTRTEVKAQVRLRL